MKCKLLVSIKKFWADLVSCDITKPLQKFADWCQIDSRFQKPSHALDYVRKAANGRFEDKIISSPSRPMSVYSLVMSAKDGTKEVVTLGPVTEP